MSRPDLFIGVVTYAGTQFPESSTDRGLAYSLAELMPRTVVEINSSNLWTPAHPPSPQEARDSQTAELRAERRWAQFLGHSRKLSFLGRISARWAKFGLRSLREFDADTVTRLMNIECSHLDLWNKALRSNAEFVLILEDDAGSDQTDDLAAGLQAWRDKGLRPSFINLSASFDTHQLDLSDLLSVDPGVTWSGTQRRTVLRASRPVTNTVCAVLYGREFLRKFVDRWEAAPTSPVLPIDWKMNMVLMDMFTAGAFAEHPVWWLEPAPIQQRSMA